MILKYCYMSIIPTTVSSNDADTCFPILPSICSILICPLTHPAELHISLLTLNIRWEGGDRGVILKPKVYPQLVVSLKAASWLSFSNVNFIFSLDQGVGHCMPHDSIIWRMVKPTIIQVQSFWGISRLRPTETKTESLATQWLYQIRIIN